jgi:hypothetical protein
VESFEVDETPLTDRAFLIEKDPGKVSSLPGSTSARN